MLNSEKTPTPTQELADVSRKSVLIIEDDAALARVLTYLLSREGFRVEHVVDGAAAVSRLDGAPVDGVVLGLMLPVVDGFKVLDALRQRATWQRTAVVVLSELSTESVVARVLKGGADDFVAKPFQPQELIARLSHRMRCLCLNSSLVH